MKNLQMKLDTVGSIFFCIGTFVFAFNFSPINLSWIGYSSAFLAIFGAIIVITSGRITRFIKGKEE
ncbi:hypothetical protein LCGC14_0669170 [marine sediment metagenome]|uniref:Uncharacterized protein n=1 Tax=marine sediment metagenome TaxID=412755 RepID=A0A0F9QRE6_9ZZZZ